MYAKIKKYITSKFGMIMTQQDKKIQENSAIGSIEYIMRQNPDASLPQILQMWRQTQVKEKTQQKSINQIEDTSTKSSTMNSTIKEYKDIKPGDIIISHNVNTDNEYMPSWSKGISLLVISKDRSSFLVIGVPKGRESHQTWHIGADNYNKLKNCFEWYINNKLDLTPIQEQLLELPVVERILPKDQRIDEEVFNLVKDGVLPSQEEMRLLLLKYHKALVTSEENIRLYNKILFDDGNSNPISENQPAEVMEMDYIINPFLTKPSRIPSVKKKQNLYTSPEEENFNWQIRGNTTNVFNTLYNTLAENPFYKEEAAPTEVKEPLGKIQEEE